MTDGTSGDGGWFDGVDPGDCDGMRAAIENRIAEDPADWPGRAVDSGFAADEDEYYDRLHEATLETARERVAARERAADRQLIHAIRAMEDCRRTANELAERLAEWAGSVDADAGTGVEYARKLSARDPGPGEERLVSLATRVAALADEADDLRAFVERETPTVAPNLAALAGPILAARLVSLAGGLEALAKRPSGTVQVLGAEDALFAHLRGQAPSPKHGIIYTHEYVRGTRPADRGSAARALAGKLAIASRIDHYSGDYRPELEAELDERIATIRARADDGDTEPNDGSANGGDDSDD